jgi:anaerobic selenocysteine-containing dehydrogenase
MNTADLKRSVCPYDCPDACGLLVEVQDGRAVRVLGDVEHPFTRGVLCPKMVHYERTVHSARRLTGPLLRTGKKGAGSFRTVCWEEAINHIAGRWQKIIADYGAEAILPFSYAGTMGTVQRNAGHPFFHYLGASRLDRTICAPAKDFGWKAVMGETPGPHPDEVMNSDFIILWGTNSVATNIHFLHGVRKAKERGAVVWLIDTYHTPTAKIADRVFLVRPGSDGALALGMIREIAQAGLLHRKFIERHVQGFSEWNEKVLPAYTPEAVSEITGLAPADITEFAQAYGKAKAPFIRLGSGLSRYGNGAMTVRIITCLPAVVGAWEKRGGGLLGDLSTGSVLNTDLITRPDFMKNPTRIINMNQLGQVLAAEDNPPIMSLYVYHANPAAVVPDQNAVLAGLGRENLFTVVHERFMTDTAIYADVVLPATTSLEHEDIYRSYGHYGIQLASPVISPVGEAKSNWEVFSLLAQAMGIQEDFFRKTAAELIDGLLTKPTAWLAKSDMERLKSGKAVELPLPKGYKTQFKTPSGKIEIYNGLEAEKLPRYLAPYGDDAPYWLVTAPTTVLLNSTFNEREDLLSQSEGMTLQMNPRDAAAKNLRDGEPVTAFNCRGETAFILCVTERVPAGVVVAEGVWSLQNTPGERNVNALTSQRLTDLGGGSTFYDTKVDVRAGMTINPCG